MFKLAKKQMGWNKTGPPLAFLQEGSMVRSPLAMANIQINHYHNKIKKTDSAITYHQSTPTRYPQEGNGQMARQYNSCQE